jgi:amidase
MNRREFLKLAALGGAGFLATPVMAWRAETGEARGRAVRPAPFELDEFTIAQLQAGMKSGQFTTVSLARKYLERIKQIDHRGPAINAIIELNPDALAIAHALDKERKSGHLRGPLHGIPVLVKDNVDTHDRMTTTAGSLALEGSIPPRDSFVAEKLRAAGAVLLGKTNLSEWANFRSTHSSSGWSGRGGQTINPYALDRNPSGSSSGSAAAVAANLCAVAVGTETDGSILSPASYTGLVGIKPTLGLISRAGIIPIAHSQDTAGPMARTVTDAAILLSCLAGTDSRDAATQMRPGTTVSDFTQGFGPSGLSGARLGVARKFFGIHKEADQCMEAALAAMKQLGATLIDPADLPTHGKFLDSELEVLLYEFKADLNAYLTVLGPTARVRTLDDIIRFNERNKREMPFFGQELFMQAQAKGPLTDKTYLDALAQNHRMTRTEGIDAIMDQHRLDALVAPTAGPAHALDLVYGDRDTGGSTSPAAVAGYPSITVPAGQVHGLPVGISFFGRAWSEPKLLSLAYAFEQAAKARKPPQFLPTVDAVK